MVIQDIRVVTRAELADLIETAENPILSIYHPTDQRAAEPAENSLHLKNLIGQAHEKLRERGLQGKELDEFLSPLEEMIPDNDLWLHQLAGIAIFRTRDSLHYFKLPYGTPEVTVVGDAPYVKPLLPAIWPDERFYIVAFSHNVVRLLHCTRHGYEEFDLSERDFPHSVAEELRYDDLQKPDSLHHPTTGPGRGPEARTTGNANEQATRKHGFHGHGEDGDDQKKQLQRFFQDVDPGLMKLLHGEAVPIISAGVDYLHPFFREASSYPNILDEHINGAIDRLRSDQLHQQALPIMKRHRRAEFDALGERYGSAGAHGLASSELEEILLAAHEGRIDTLFVDRTKPEWGVYDPTIGRVSLRPEIEGFEGTVIDLHDLAARRVIENSGVVYVVDDEEMPAGARIAALFRFNPAL